MHPYLPNWLNLYRLLNPLVWLLPGAHWRAFPIHTEFTPPCYYLYSITISYFDSRVANSAGGSFTLAAANDLYVTGPAVTSVTSILLDSQEPHGVLRCATRKLVTPVENAHGGVTNVAYCTRDFLAISPVASVGQDSSSSVVSKAKDDP
jgi:hypothetical protein